MKRDVKMIPVVREYVSELWVEYRGEVVWAGRGYQCADICTHNPQPHQLP